MVTNADLIRENPHWNMAKVEPKSGVFERHIARENETAFDLSKKAVDKLRENNPGLLSKIDCIIYCTQSPDYIMPSNAYLMHNYLKLDNNILAFDYNLACSGFVYGLAFANSFIKSGLRNNILLFNADTYSKYINKKDRSARVLFGDGASVSYITKNNSGKGVIDFEISSSGKSFDKFFIPAGGCRIPKSQNTSNESEDENGNIRTENDIYMDGMGVWIFINSEVPKVIKKLLSRNNLKLNDLDLFIFHQASKMTLDSLVKVLGIKKEKSFTNIGKIGNTVSASIPIALKDAMSQGFIPQNSKILVAGFGVGLSVAASIIQY